MGVCGGRRIMEETLLEKPAPCKECKTRRVSCHSICPLYKKWRKEYEALAKIRKKRENFVFINRDLNKYSKW